MQRPVWWGLLVFVLGCGFPRPDRLPDDGGILPPSDPRSLLAISPEIATAGATITLEGTFPDDLMIAFSGLPPISPTTHGSHRATVTVPAGAKPGSLTVLAASEPLDSLPVHITSFALGLQPFRASYEQADIARQTPDFVTPRAGHSSLVVGNAIYVIGGRANVAQLTIERASINADGTLGAFVQLPNVTLFTERTDHTSVLIGRSVYALGGESTHGRLDSIERARLDDRGELGSFATAGSLVAARSGHASVRIGGAIYVIGGTSVGGAALTSIERATVGFDDGLGTFSIVPDVALAVPRTGCTAVVAADALYVLGGSDGAGIQLASIERADIHPDGSLGPFSLVRGVALATPRSAHASILLGDAIYVIGGQGSAGPLASIERAPLDREGKLGAFAPLAEVALASGRAGLTLTMVGDVLYALGGSGPSAGLVRATQWAHVNASGALGKPARALATLPDGRDGGVAAVLGDHLYVVGGALGTTPLRTVARAEIRRDGSLGPFTIAADTALVTPRTGHAGAIVASWFYVVGGANGSYLESVERAEIRSDGSLGPFTLVPGRTLVTPRNAPRLAILGRNLYVVGGAQSAAADLVSVEWAELASDGAIGPFAIEAGVSLTTGRFGGATAVTGGYLHVLAGTGAAGVGDGIERAAIDPTTGRLSAFSVAPIALNTRRFFHSASLVGNALYVLGGSGAGGAPASTSLERATVRSDGTLGAFTALPALPLAARHISHASVVLGNVLYALGGTADAVSSVEAAALE